MQHEAVRTSKQTRIEREKTGVQAIQHALHTGAPLMRRTLFRSEPVSADAAYALWGRGLEGELFVDLGGS